MNKILRYSFIAIMAMVFGNVAAQDPDVTIATNSSTFSASGDDYVATSDGVTLTYSKGTSTTAISGGLQSAHLRVYKNALFTISSAEKDMAKIVVTAVINNKIGADGFTANGYEAASDQLTGTWTGNSKSVLLTASGGQVRLTKVEVYFADASDTRTATTIAFGDDGYETRATCGKDEQVGLPSYQVLKDGTTDAIDATVTWSLAKTSGNEKLDDAAINGNYVTIPNGAWGELKVTASFEGNSTYKASSKSYTLTVYKGRMNIAEFMDEFVKEYNDGGGMTSWSTQVLTSYWQVAENGSQITSMDAVVTYVNGSNTYIQDETGRGLLLYGSNLGLEKGDVITGDLGNGKIGAIYGKLYTHNGLLELSTTKENIEFKVKSKGASVNCFTITADKLVENLNNYVEIKDAEYVSTTAGTGNNPKNTYSFKIGEQSLTVYDQWKAGAEETFVVGAKYKLRGMAAFYMKSDGTNKTPQLYYLTSEKTADPSGISELKANSTLNAVRYNLAGQKVNASYKGVVIMNGSKMMQK